MVNKNLCCKRKLRAVKEGEVTVEGLGNESLGTAVGYVVDSRHGQILPGGEEVVEAALLHPSNLTDLLEAYIGVAVTVKAFRTVLRMRVRAPMAVHEGESSSPVLISSGNSDERTLLTLVLLQSAGDGARHSSELSTFI
jgi:hypothetical protein